MKSYNQNIVKTISSTLVVGVVLSVNFLAPIITHADVTDYGSYGYEGTTDYGSYGYGATTDYGTYGYGNTIDYGSYGYASGATDYGTYGYGDSGATDYGTYGYNSGATDYGTYGYADSVDYVSTVSAAPMYSSVGVSYSAPVYSAQVYSSQSYGYATTPSYVAAASYVAAPVYKSPQVAAVSYSAPTYQAPVYNAPTYQAPVYNAPVYNAPTYNAPTYNAPTYQAPTYNTPYATPYQTPYTYPTPAYSYPTPAYSYPTPSYSYPTPYTTPYPTPVTQQLPFVTISSNPSIINFGGSSLLTWSSSNANNCFASNGWSGTKNLSGTETVSPQISTTYTIACSNNVGQSTAQTIVSVNNQQSLAPAVNITANPNVISIGGTSLLVWSSSNATNCFASGAWSGTKALSGSEVISPTINSTYQITCSNNVGSANDSDSVIVNSVLGQPPITGLTAACVASPSIVSVNRRVQFVAGQFGGQAPYSYAWNGDIAGSGEITSFVFSTTGTKTVTLRVTDGNGRVATANCSVRVNPVVVTIAPPVEPPVVLATTDYATICEALGYVKPVVQAAAPVCKTYTSCSDGTTYEGTDKDSNVITNANNTTAQGNGTGNGATTQASQTTTATTQTANGNGSKSLLASIFLNGAGSPSRLGFVLIWYILVLLFVGFIALIYSAVRRREV